MLLRSTKIQSVWPLQYRCKQWRSEADFVNIKGPRNRFQGIDSASTTTLFVGPNRGLQDGRIDSLESITIGIDSWAPSTYKFGRWQDYTVTHSYSTQHPNKFVKYVPPELGVKYICKCFFILLIVFLVKLNATARERSAAH